jgi:hypothetical protein
VRRRECCRTSATESGSSAAEKVSAAEQRGSECDGDNEFDGANAAGRVRRSKCGGASAAGGCRVERVHATIDAKNSTVSRQENIFSHKSKNSILDFSRDHQFSTN